MNSVQYRLERGEEHIGIIEVFELFFVVTQSA